MADIGGGDQFDVIVIGAGIMGSCAAYEAAKRGHTVLLLEQFDFLHHRGSSHGESRTIRSTYPEPYYTSMVSESFRLWQEAEAEIGYRVLSKSPHFDMGPSDSRSLQAVIDGCLSRSADGRVLDHSQAAGVFSGAFRLPAGWVGLVTEGGVIKPTKAVAMFQSLAVRRGAVLRDHAEVVDIEKPDRGGIMVTIAAGQKFAGKKCVVTAGAWTRKLMKKVGDESLIGLPIQPLHTLICYWKIKAGYEDKLRLEAGFPSFASYGDPYIYGTPSMEFPGLIKVAMHGGAQCDPDKRDWSISADVVKGVGKWIEELMPSCVESGHPAMVQGCMYSMTPDGDFVLDFVGGKFGKDIVVAGGFSGHGFKMGPLIGKILVDMAMKGEVDEEDVGVEMKWFISARFVEDPKGNAKEYEDQVSSCLI